MHHFCTTEYPLNNIFNGYKHFPISIFIFTHTSNSAFIL